MITLLAWVLPVAAQGADKPPAGYADYRIRVCESHKPRVYAVPSDPEAIRETLELRTGEKILVEPALRLDMASHYDARFDYRIISRGIEHRISEFGTTREEREDFTYRRLVATGLYCVSANEALIYLSFAVNGSMRDYLYIGIYVTEHDFHPIVIGLSSYGVLAIDRREPLRFELWQSTDDTAANAMDAHVYRVRTYQWLNPNSTHLLGERVTGPRYPSQVMGKGQESIRIGVTGRE